jgi:shikimate kinase
MKIFLIGMPGCGKSTFGRKASEQLSMTFIDLDTEIVNYTQKSINDIFEQEGEEYFRKIESKLLKSISENKDHFIMATGGGAPCFFDNMEFMNDQGITFYIDTDITFLLKRLSRKGINKRPLLKKIGVENLENGLSEKLKERLPFYSKAQVILPYQKELENQIVLHVHSRIKNQN